MTMAIRNTPKRSLKTLYVATNSTFLITTCSVEGPPVLSEAGWLVRRRRINVYYICGWWAAGLVGAGQDTNDAAQLFSAAADTAV